MQPQQSKFGGIFIIYVGQLACDSCLINVAKSADNGQWFYFNFSRSLFRQMYASVLTAEGRHTMNQRNTFESWICSKFHLIPFRLYEIPFFERWRYRNHCIQFERGEWGKQCKSHLIAWSVLDDRLSIIYCRRLFFIVCAAMSATLKWHFWIWFNPCTFHISINCSRRMNFVCCEFIRPSHMMNDVIDDGIFSEKERQGATEHKLVLIYTQIDFSA